MIFQSDVDEVALYAMRMQSIIKFEFAECKTCYVLSAEKGEEHSDSPTTDRIISITVTSNASN